MLTVTDALSLAGGSCNQDHYRYEGNTVLLLDGASGLGRGVGDPTEFVHCFADAFFEKVRQGIPLYQAVNLALETVQTETDGIPPSASLMAVQRQDDTLRLLNIGDCTALLFAADQTVQRIHCDAVPLLDEQVAIHLRRLREQTGKHVIELVGDESVLQMLRGNRAKMNTPDGYEILARGMRPRCAEDVQVLDARRFTRIILHTDGFDAVQPLLCSLPTPPLQQVYRQLRALEAQDAYWDERPRFKAGDDASALVIEI